MLLVVINITMKIGVGVITCNREKFLNGLLSTLNDCTDINELVIVNDGKHVSDLSIKLPYTYLHNETNLGVAKSKNIAMKHLLEKNCDYIFILEDDMLILNTGVFQQYIKASQRSGIQHFNYGPGSPFNRKQQIKFDLHNRHLLDQHSALNPRSIIDYGDIKIALYEHSVAMFSFFTKTVLEKVGLIDEEYYNAWEHVDHTYRIIKAGFHPPFWWFADIYDSDKYLSEAPDAINQSTIASNNVQWHQNVLKGGEIYKRKHGHYPNQPPPFTLDQVIPILKQLKNIK